MMTRQKIGEGQLEHGHAELIQVKCHVWDITQKNFVILSDISSSSLTYLDGQLYISEKMSEKYNLLKAFLLLSHFHLLFPRLLLPTASSYLHLARSHHQLRRNCVNIKISSKASEKYRLRFEFLYKVGRAFLVKCIHCGGARLGVFLSYILSSILRRFYSCYSQNGIYSADKAD